MIATDAPPEALPVNVRRMLAHVCKGSVLGTARTFFRERDGQPLIVSAHHRIIADALDNVIKGHTRRLIINIPPGYTKTELAVIFFITHGLLINPRSKFLHTSYSGDLALLNSGIIKDIIQSDLFQSITPMELRADTKAKARWYTSQGGGMMAAAAGGQITGFRAGRMDKTKFTGALIIDDPIKPMDALSDAMREAVNRNFLLTVKSRLATEAVPIIVIMQRVHENDLTGFLLRGGSGDRWAHLMMPAVIPEYPDQYPTAYTHGEPIPYTLPPGPLWEYKQNAEELDVIRRGNDYTWASQYLQDPTSTETAMIQRSWFPRYHAYHGGRAEIEIDDRRVKITQTAIFADTAMKTGERNDFSVFQFWGYGEDDRIYLLDQVRGKWPAPDLDLKFSQFIERWKYDSAVNSTPPRMIAVEDKASGTGLIQSINKRILEGSDPKLRGAPEIIGIQRATDKVSRAFGAAPFIKRGQVVVPQRGYWVEDFLLEVEKFNAAMSHAHDDQIDPMLDAIDHYLINCPQVDYSAVVGM